jgi:Glycosyl transferase family 2
MTDAARPELSIILTVADSGPVLRRCLEALKAQEHAPSMEVLVPFDATVPEVANFAAEYPDFIFMDLGALTDERPINAFEQHGLFERRRSAGLYKARADLIAIIEDRGWPRRDWARKMVEAHRQFDDGVIGGAVESAAESLARWAIFFVDYGRYQAPFDSEHPDYVTDINICYKRAALWRAEHLWQRMYQECEVNWFLRDLGIGLRLTPNPRTVQQRAGIGLVEMAMERVHWGRGFGQVRARGASFGNRLKWCIITPILPAALYLRHLKRQMRLGLHLREFALATPIILYLLSLWSIGELIGYLEPDRKAKEA